MNAYIASIAKALVAGAVAGAGAGATAAIDDRITTGEWWMVAATALTAAAGTWGIPNIYSTDRPGRHAAKEDADA